MCETGPLLSFSHREVCHSPMLELSRRRLFAPDIPSAATVMAAVMLLSGSQAWPESYMDQAKDRNSSVLGWRVPRHRKSKHYFFIRASEIVVVKFLVKA